MANKVVVFLKSIGRLWFLFLLLAILIVYIYAQEVAIWMTVITIILFLLSYLPGLFTRGKLVHFLKDYYMIEDDTVAEELGKPLREVRKEMFELMQNQKRKKWLIVFLNKRYIFFHPLTVQKFKELYHEGYEEKELLQELKENDLRTKEEVKVIKKTLQKNGRLGKRKVSVKERKDKMKYEI